MDISTQKLVLLGALGSLAWECEHISDFLQDCDCITSQQVKELNFLVHNLCDVIEKYVSMD